MKKRILLGSIVTLALLAIIGFIAQYRSNQSFVHIEGEILIPRPVADVWTYIATDFDKIQDYSAGVKKSYYTNGHYQAVVGAERNCEVFPEGYITEQITEFDVNNRMLAFEVKAGDLPIDIAVGTWELYEVEGGTRVVEKVDFRMKYFFMNGPAEKNFQEGINQNLAGLKNLVLNGTSATPDNISSIMSEYWEQ
ncbi:MAG: SRPBCC family protein [Cyclobacteriaceae bacterium]|nr:SRPBCC family protein [Cyclobacteriaceae bacterium HetDA_MAG_MS6]